MKLMKWTYRFLLIRILGKSRVVLMRLLRCAHVVLYTPIVVPILVPHDFVLDDATLVAPTGGMVNIGMMVIVSHRVGIGRGELILRWHRVPRIAPSMILIRVITFKGLLRVRHATRHK